MTTHFMISGMSCQHCVRAVKEALESVPNVTAVTVDLESGTATVESLGADAADMIAALKEEGYEASLSS